MKSKNFYLIFLRYTTDAECFMKILSSFGKEFSAEDVDKFLHCVKLNHSLVKKNDFYHVTVKISKIAEFGGEIL